jgi:hypothetical protein
VDAAAPHLPGPISPELVLVSPPDVARMARLLLPSPPATRAVPTLTPAVLEASPGAVEFTVVWLICLAMTLGPLVFLLAQT